MVSPRFSRFASAALGLALMLIVFAAIPPVARAQASMSLLSNLDVMPNTTSGAGTLITAGGTQRAVAFTTGADAFTLTSVQATLATSGTSSVLSFGLYTQSTTTPNDPGTLVADLGTNTVTNQASTPTQYTFSSSSGYVMTANTRYVLLCDYVSGDDGQWLNTNPATAPTARNGSGYNTPVYRNSFNDGASYGNAPASTFNQFSLNGTVVSTDTSEPGSLALLGMGVVPLAGLITRRRRHAAKTTA